MPILAKCPGCQETYNLKDHLAGMRMTCPKCHGSISVPQTSVASRPAPSVPPAQSTPVVGPVRASPDKAAWARFAGVLASIRFALMFVAIGVFPLAAVGIATILLRPRGGWAEVLLIVGGLGAGSLAVGGLLFLIAMARAAFRAPRTTLAGLATAVLLAPFFSIVFLLLSAVVFRRLHNLPDELQIAFSSVFFGLPGQMLFVSFLKGTAWCFGNHALQRRAEVYRMVSLLASLAVIGMPLLMLMVDMSRYENLIVLLTNMLIIIGGPFFTMWLWRIVNDTCDLVEDAPVLVSGSIQEPMGTPVPLEQGRPVPAKSKLPWLIAGACLGIVMLVGSLLVVAAVFLIKVGESTVVSTSRTIATGKAAGPDFIEPLPKLTVGTFGTWEVQLMRLEFATFAGNRPDRRVLVYALNGNNPTDHLLVYLRTKCVKNLTVDAPPGITRLPSFHIKGRTDFLPIKAIRPAKIAETARDVELMPMAGILGFGGGGRFKVGDQADLVVVLQLSQKDDPGVIADQGVILQVQGLKPGCDDFELPPMRPGKLD